MGECTWNWSVFPASKCKPQNINKFNGPTKQFATGSHMSLITFIGDAKDSSRSQQAKVERDSKAAVRGIGWDYASIKKREMQSRASGSGYQQR